MNFVCVVVRFQFFCLVISFITKWLEAVSIMHTVLRYVSFNISPLSWIMQWKKSKLWILRVDYLKRVVFLQELCWNTREKTSRSFVVRKYDSERKPAMQSIYIFMVNAVENKWLTVTISRLADDFQPVSVAEKITGKWPFYIFEFRVVNFIAGCKIFIEKSKLFIWKK